MATIERRTDKDGQLVYRVKVRRRGTLLQTATFTKPLEAHKWAMEIYPVTDCHFQISETDAHCSEDFLLPLNMASRWLSASCTFSDEGATNCDIRSFNIVLCSMSRAERA